MLLTSCSIINVPGFNNTTISKTVTKSTTSSNTTKETEKTTQRQLNYYCYLFGFGDIVFAGQSENTITVSSDTSEFVFPNYIDVSSGATIEILVNNQIYTDNILQLSPGQNTIEILVTAEDKVHSNQYTLNIYRLKTYTISYNTDGGNDIPSVVVDENTKVLIPSIIPE